MSYDDVSTDYGYSDPKIVGGHKKGLRGNHIPWKLTFIDVSKENWP
jgi:hypothetical protein